MKEHSLTKWLDSLSCNGCKYFIDDKCNHEKAEQNEKDKPFLVEHALKKGNTFSTEWAKNIDNHFVCDNFESRSVGNF